MSCISQGKLRAYLDGELCADEIERIARHLQACTRCQHRLAEVQGAAQVSARRLNQLAPTRLPDVRRALANVRARAYSRVPSRAREDNNTAWYRRIWDMSKSKTWRTALAGTVATGLVAFVCSFAPARALAQQFLSIFRVDKFVAVSVEPDQAQIQALGNLLEDKLAGMEPEFVADEPEVAVGSIEEASALAGFEVRMPSYLPGDGEVGYSVKGRTEATATVDRDTVAMVLETAGMDAGALPADWEGGEIRAIAPSMVSITQTQDSGFTMVLQVPGARVEYPGGLEPSLLGEAGLRLLGLSESQAHAIAQRVDWTSTVLLPVPTSVASFQETRIADEEAVILTSAEGQELTTAEGIQYGVIRAIVWEKDDVLYCVMGSHSAEYLAQVAESMF